MSQRRLPPEVYWRRRLLVLAVVILLVWAAFTWWPDGDDAADVAPRPTATTPAPAATDGSIKVTLASASTPCDPESIRITPTVPSGQHTGGPVDIDLLVSTTSTEPCTFTAKSTDLLVVISSGSSAIWDSTVCKTALIEPPVQLSPGWATSVPTTWTGRGSGQSCASNEGYASPGTYVLKIGTLGGEPGQDSFRLTRAPKSDASPTPTPSGTPTKKKS